MKLVAFNGPPRSGKDTAAGFLITDRQAVHVKMSRPIKTALIQFFNLSVDQIKHLEKHKEEPSPLLFGYSWRDAEISFSEEWVKEKFGVYAFGHLMVATLQRTVGQFVVCSDAGFDFEWPPVIAHIGAKNMLVIRLHRDGCDFSKDSRSYIDLTSHGVQCTDMQNLFDLEMYREQVNLAVSKWLDQQAN